MVYVALVCDVLGKNTGWQSPNFMFLRFTFHVHPDANNYFTH